jgi:hypothetical protein
VRELKSGEDAISIYDDIHHEGTKFLQVELGREGGERRYEIPKHLFYNEADALEDKVLFPDELQDNPSMSSLQITTAAHHLTKPNLTTLETDGFNMERWIHDIDSDEDTEEDSDEDSDADGGSSSAAQNDEVKDWPTDSSSNSSDGDDSTDPGDMLIGDQSEQSSKLQRQKFRKITKLMEAWMLNQHTQIRPMKEEWDIWLDKERAKGISSIHQPNIVGLY